MSSIVQKQLFEIFVWLFDFLKTDSLHPTFSTQAPLAVANAPPIAHNIEASCTKGKEKAKATTMPNGAAYLYPAVRNFVSDRCLQRC